MNLLDTAASLITPLNLAILFASTGMGVLVGAVPGLTVTLALGILLGYLTYMPIEHGLSILCGIYVGGIYGGSLTAILCKIPGTGSSMATLLDGHPIALAGRAIHAIRLTRFASVIGTFIGCVALLIFTPLLIHFAKNANSPVIFTIALFALAASMYVSAMESKLKGVIGGLIGLLVSMIGMDDHGVARMTFGFDELLSGIQLVPFLIGLYVIPEILKFYYSFDGQRAKAPAAICADYPIKRTLGTIKNNFRVITQSSMIGVLIGALPGVGEDTAAWSAYGMAKKASKEPEAYGKGSEEGVIAPEVANNAAIGGALVPVLALGIPGSAPAAMFMGALLLYGITPGPLFNVDYPGLLEKMVVNFFLADVMLLLSASALLKPLIRILTIDRQWLMPFVFIIAVIGAYSISLSWFEVRLMILMGIGAFILVCFNYPQAPIAVGFILGNMIDIKFRTTLLANDGSITAFFTNPASVFLGWLCILAIFLKLYKWHHGGKSKDNEPVNNG